MPEQPLWRRCKACNTLFFDGFEHSGVCTATPNHSGEHAPAAGSYRLAHDVPELTPFLDMQSGWRNCHKCQALYYGPTNGPCPGPNIPGTIAGVHYGGQNQGGVFPESVWNFYLHKNATPEGGENNWRACWKCLALVYDKPITKGPCPAGGSHESHGNESGVANFALNVDT
jgi:hypothetical protein